MIALVVAGLAFSNFAASAQDAVEIEEGEAGEVDVEEAAEPTAQEAFDRPGVEEYIVTAEKRESAVQDTPLSVSVFNMEELDIGGIQDVEGLSFSIPNFHYGEVLGAASITIRGIATTGGDQATAFHIDGIYQDNPYTASGIAFYDLQRVEVLRGPQGTLYGRNATGGSVNVLTNPPSFDYYASADAEIGNYHVLRFRSIFNVPLVDDVLAMRVSSVFNRRYGYTENLSTGIHRDDLDDDRSWAIRSQLRFQPSDLLDWIVRFTFVRDQSNGLSTKIDGDYPSAVPLLPGGGDVDIYVNASAPNPRDPRKIYLDTKTRNDRDFYMANSKLQLDLGEVDVLGDTTLTLLAGWQRSEQDGVGDVDLSDAFSRGLPGTAFEGPFPMIVADISGSATEWVAEANLDVEAPIESDWMSLRWMIGAFYLETYTEGDIVSDVNFELSQGADGMSPVLAQSTDASRVKGWAKSAAGFANLDWILFDDFTVFGGVRYSWDWKKASVDAPQVDFFVPSANFTIPCVVAGLDDRVSDSWDGVTGRVGAEWQFADDNMVYGSFSLGYKAGGVGLPVAAAGCTRVDVDDVEPERVYAWELGTKNQFWNQKIQLNLTGFAYIYEDIQVTTLVEASFVTENADSARILGAELELVALPFLDVSMPVLSIETLMFTFNVGYTYSEFTDYDNGCLVETPSTCMPPPAPTTPPNPNLPPGPQDWTGNQLPRSPTYTLTLAMQLEQDLGRYGSLIPYARFFHSDDLYFRAANRSRDRQESYELVDASLTWKSPIEGLTLEAFVQNVFNEDIVSTKLVSSPLIGAPTVSAYYPPRTVGMRLGFDW